jgi:hypothetical protein
MAHRNPSAPEDLSTNRARTGRVDPFPLPTSRSGALLSPAPHVPRSPVGANCSPDGASREERQECPLEWKQRAHGTETRIPDSPPGPGTLRGRGGQTPLDPLPCGGETRTSSSQSFQQSGCIADQGVGSIVLQPALLRADGSRRRLLWLPRSRSLRRRMRRGAADFSTVLFD